MPPFATGQAAIAIAYAALQEIRETERADLQDGKKHTVQQHTAKKKQEQAKEKKSDSSSSSSSSEESVNKEKKSKDKMTTKSRGKQAVVRPLPAIPRGSRT